MRKLVRLLLCALLSAGGVLLVPSPSFAATATTVDVCEVLGVTPCPTELTEVTTSSAGNVDLSNGCRSQFQDLPPSVHWYYDPDLGASYPIIYQGVSVEIFCPRPTDVVAVAVSQPTALTSPGSKTHVERRCVAATYCSATAVWAHNLLLDEPVCAYTTASAVMHLQPVVPYFPRYTTAGWNCW